MFTEKQFDTGQVVINYAEGAATGSPLVLLHGATQRWQAWGPFLAQLEKTWHVYACDLRGHGKTGRAASGYRAVDFFPDTTALIQEVIRKPVILMGHSLGGTLATGIAAQIPDLMQAVIFLDPGFFSREVTVKDSGWPFDYLRGVHDFLSGVRSSEQVWSDLGWDPAGMQDWAKRMRNLDIEMVTSLLYDHLFDDFDLGQALRRITCPALLLYGEQEKGGVVRKSDIEFFHANAPHATSALIQDAGHMVYQDQPAQVLVQMERFLIR